MVYQHSSDERLSKVNKKIYQLCGFAIPWCLQTYLKFQKQMIWIYELDGAPFFQKRIGVGGMFDENRIQTAISNICQYIINGWQWHQRGICYVVHRYVTVINKYMKNYYASTFSLLNFYCFLLMIYCFY